MKPFIGIDITENKKNTEFNGKEFVVQTTTPTMLEAYNKATDDIKAALQSEFGAEANSSIFFVADELKIVYSPLHGTGHKLIPEILSRTGIKHLYKVEEQFVIDGNFPTVSKPNPEYAEVFELGIAIADRVGSNLVVATDPDADRVGVVARTKDGSFKTITGNQMGALLIDYIITAYEETGTMPDQPYVVKSIVSSELATKLGRIWGKTIVGYSANCIGSGQ